MKNLFAAPLCAIMLLCSHGLQAKTYHISPNGSNKCSGDVASPMRTISRAAHLAIAGDTILIHEGVYREWVSPQNSGMTNMNRITYMAAEGEEVHIKGSEPIPNWKKVSKGVWRAEVDNILFGDFNPFQINLYGDWLIKGGELSLGEVYLNDVGLTEQLVLDSLYTISNSWYADVDDDNTVIYASFGDANPNKELVEVNVRAACFSPKSTGVNYITVKGLNISQAATQWSAPTASQEGAIDPNWSKGWIIEDCVVSNSKNVGICLGKDKASGHNNWYNFRGKTPYTKPGFTYEIEAIIAALDLGWSRENIGSHVVRNNRIFSCGQAGIVGHMGCAFSVIEGNEIYDIALSDKVFGYETSGIKLHAAIDVVLKNNIIYRTIRGIWLDWQAQGTHICGNIMYDNGFREDLFIEVSHGPTLVYNNIMLSDKTLLVDAQGIAYFNNLIGAKIIIRASSERYTPYHKAHSTELKGLFNTTGGDIRAYNNVLLANGVEADAKVGANGFAAYDAYPAYDAEAKMPSSIVSDRQYLSYKFPISTSGNIYFSSSAEPYVNEQNHVVVESEDPYAKIVEEDGKFYLETNLSANSLKKATTVMINTDMLGETIISEGAFENVDSSYFTLDSDLFGAKRNVDNPTAGPIESLPSERILVWQRR